MVVASGEQRGASRGADRRAAVVLGAAHALGREPVDVGRGQDGVAVAAQVAVAQVVGHDKDDVGTRRRRCGSHARRGRAAGALPFQVRAGCLRCCSWPWPTTL